MGPPRRGRRQRVPAALHRDAGEEGQGLRAARRAQERRRALLATDEDREGEAIAWHLLDTLKPKVPVRRMVFHEITEPAIRAAAANLRELDQDLVDAQETRRILDRLYGYEVSPVLWKKVMPRLSAGRVQSVATRIIVQRERERMAFVAGRLLGHRRDAGRRGASATPRTFRRPARHRRRRPDRHRPRLRPATGSCKAGDRRAGARRGQRPPPRRGAARRATWPSPRSSRGPTRASRTRRS